MIRNVSAASVRNNNIKGKDMERSGIELAAFAVAFFGFIFLTVGIVVNSVIILLSAVVVMLLVFAWFRLMQRF